VHAWRRDFQRRLADGGWAAVHWPAEHGGRDATLTESAIFFEELGRSGAPLPANVLGLLLAGPTIMLYGTPEQKASPRIHGNPRLSSRFQALVPEMERDSRRCPPIRAGQKSPTCRDF
jgi:hypothetical protein